MAKYVAFLRGVNLGKRTVKKGDLLAAYSKMGLKSAQTFLASGNVLFESAAHPVVSDIETGLADKFGFEIGVVLRSITDLQNMVAGEPFAAYEGGRDTKLYVTMAAGPIDDRMKGISSVPGDFDLVDVKEKEYFTVAFRQGSGRFGSGMDHFEKRFKDALITTRNWNTILRIVTKASS